MRRTENTDHPERLSEIVDAIIAAARELPVVWPLHLRTRPVRQRAGLLEPLAKSDGYLDMVQSKKHAALIATDLGGVQKEAFFCRLPCVTLRNENEWVELLEVEWNRLAPPISAAVVFDAIPAALGSTDQRVSFFSADDASKMIVN